MCKYYAHSFACKHTSFTFARFCRDANMIQTPCGARDVWTTIRMDEACGECKTRGKEEDGIDGGPWKGLQRVGCALGTNSPLRRGDQTLLSVGPVGCRLWGVGFAASLRKTIVTHHGMEKSCGLAVKISLLYLFTGSSHHKCTA
ncbi:hypothetical protein B0T25DRAFT_515379 [Lasiosphaeria hispida]|uniref:Uncharacterized protein n=1 Tax=Lasiosphaeria hispida TaxID=260671 RepID=A0AAJ0MI97_9PEZI|nr:hypothetical protein B0T25DRAFT_515379 [Lasiosphaeria hispida]